jgi:hypothetical protein
MSMRVKRVGVRPHLPHSLFKHPLCVYQDPYLVYLHPHLVFKHPLLTVQRPGQRVTDGVVLYHVVVLGAVPCVWCCGAVPYGGAGC